MAYFRTRSCVDIRRTARAHAVWDEEESMAGVQSQKTSLEPGVSSSSSSSAADALLGPRRFPRRFGKATARKNKNSGFYGPRITREVERLLPFPRPELAVDDRAPSGDWRNYARARSASVARSRFAEDVAVERPASKTRAESVGPSLFRSSAPGGLLSRRSSLPPRPVMYPAARRVVPGFVPFDVEYDEPDFRPLPRPRYRVLATRRPPGNYYDRLLRKRGTIAGRPFTEYGPESSLVGSNLSSALRRVGPMNDYSGASLLLSVEGTGVSSEGERVGFTYTPTPIHLFGSTLGLDDRFLSSRMNLQPIDNFLSGHAARMGALKSQLNHYVNIDKGRRSDVGLMPLAIGPRPMAAYIPPLAVKSLARPERPLRSTVLSGAGPGRQLDVIPLGNIRPRLPRSAASKLRLPQGLTAAGGFSLSTLDKINIKVDSESFATPQASVAARRVARGHSMIPLRATSLPPRSLYPTEVDYWVGAPPSYGSLYGLKAADTTTTDYYPDLSYARSPRPFYPNPWLYRSPSRVGLPRIAERAMSVPPAFLYPAEPRRQVRPVFDDWRRMARSVSVAADVRTPYYSRPHYYPYAGGYGSYERRLSPSYARRLALSPTREVAPLWFLPTQGMSAHKHPRYLSRVAARAGVPLAWDSHLAGRRRAEEEEELAHQLGFKAAGYRPRVLGSSLARANLARAWRHAVPHFSSAYVKDSGHGFPLLYVARKGVRHGGRHPKAALIASRMAVDTCGSRRPRSDYATRKYRALNMADKESIYTRSPQTTGYYASNPTLPKLTERKAIRTDDGYTKPKNLLSWQYRLDSLLRPRDLVYQPTGSFDRIRRQVRVAQDGLDRHRQLLDRYLPEEGADSKDAAARVLRKMAEMDKRYPMADGGAGERQRATVKIPSYYASGIDPANPPMSDLRRRIRRTLNKTKRA